MQALKEAGYQAKPAQPVQLDEDARTKAGQLAIDKILEADEAARQEALQMLQNARNQSSESANHAELAKAKAGQLAIDKILEADEARRQATSTRRG